MHVRFQTTLTFLAENCPKMDLALRKKCPYSELFWSSFSRNWTEHEEIRSISPYSARMRENAYQNNSEYGHLLRSVGFEIQKTNVGIRISILKVPCVPIFRQNG